MAPSGRQPDTRNREIARVGPAIPKHKPFNDPFVQSVNRRELIQNWWPLQSKSARVAVPSGSIGHNDGIWRQVSLMALVHRRVGRFDMFCEKLRIE